MGKPLIFVCKGKGITHLRHNSFLTDRNEWRTEETTVKKRNETDLK